MCIRDRPQENWDYLTPQSQKCAEEDINILEGWCFDMSDNRALTLEQLREMEQSTPVWWDYIPCWVLVRRGSVLAFGSEPHKVENLMGNFYRRPPEGEEHCYG